VGRIADTGGSPAGALSRFGPGREDPRRAGRPEKFHKSLGQEDVILYNAFAETSLRSRRQPASTVIHRMFR
jgi:hypothetical protein